MATRLKHSEWKLLFEAVTDLYSDDDPLTLRDRTVGSVSKLVRGEITAIDFFTNSGEHTGKNWQGPVDTISPAQYEILANVVHEHPFSPDIFLHGRLSTVMTADYLTTSQFQRTAIYNEFYRLFPVHHQLLCPVAIDANTIVTFTVNRRGRSFLEAERMMFEILAPHVRNAIVNGRKVERLIGVQNAITATLQLKEIAIAVLNDKGEILFINDCAAKMIQKYFGTSPGGAMHLPAPLSTWVAHRLRGLDGNAFFDGSGLDMILDFEKARLAVTLSPNPSERQVVLMFEEDKKVVSSQLQALGLTKRQSEILYWVAAGKTDKDIALLLSISPRTVHKHTESIYRRLGVETRTAAMRFACEMIFKLEKGISFTN